MNKTSSVATHLFAISLRNVRRIITPRSEGSNGERKACTSGMQVYKTRGPVTHSTHVVMQWCLALQWMWTPMGLLLIYI